MDDIVNLKLIGQIFHTMPAEKGKEIGMDIEPGIEIIDHYMLEYALWETGKLEDGLRIEVDAYWDMVGGYYLNDIQVHGDYEPGEDDLVKELIEGIFIREDEDEILCHKPITYSLDTMQPLEE